MSLSDQLNRVDGSQNTILKAIAKAFGISISNQKIDQVAKLVTASPKFGQDALLSATTASGLGLSSDATPNQAFAKLKTLVDAAQSAAGDKAKLVVGSYTGNETPTIEVTSRKIELGFTPKAVFVAASGSSFGTFGGYDIYPAGLAVEGVPAIAGSNFGNKDKVLEIVANGFNVYNRAASPYGIHMNDENYTYNYIAFA